ncbi:MAG: RNA 2',3'-cyclic phosphodiesterase [Ignavibacteriaceae bacterium]
MKRRLFIALEIPEDNKEQLNSTVYKIAVSIPGKCNNFRWEGKDKFHLTLKFLGETEETFLPAIKNELKYLNGKKGFNGVISKFGVFPNLKSPKVLWAGLEINPDINELIAEINDKLHQIGIIKEEKKIKPHITLLRIKENYDISFMNYFFSYNYEKKSFPLNKIVLYESKLQPGGSEYKSIENYQLI